MEWLAFIIPLISCIVAVLWFRSSFQWWEYLVSPAAVALAIVIAKGVSTSSAMKDREYWGSMIVEARYYEYWETWVHQTCSYSCNCTTDKDGNMSCQTCYYDCSYCDENGAYWEAYDDVGRSWSISQEEYNYLKSKWHATPSFVELNRSIRNHGSCGKDGDAYSIKWGGEKETSEAAVTIHNYENKTQVVRSVFNFSKIDPKKAVSEGLYEYPRLKGYKQNVVLGLDSIYSGAERERIETLFQYFNGHYGALNKVKLFVLLFYDKPVEISNDQESYWKGGNQNELIVCIGLDKAKNLTWVRPFSWTDRKRVLVDCREDIMELKTFKPDSVYLAIEHAVASNVMYKNFKVDFKYLRVEVSNTALWWIWIISFVITLGGWIWCNKNEFVTEDGDLQPAKSREVDDNFHLLYPLRKFIPRRRTYHKLRRTRFPN